MMIHWAFDTTVVNAGAFCFDEGRPCDTAHKYRAFSIGVPDLSQTGKYKLTIKLNVKVGH
jgi:hypothetical protein